MSVLAGYTDWATERRNKKLTCSQIMIDRTRRDESTRTRKRDTLRFPPPTNQLENILVSDYFFLRQLIYFLSSTNKLSGSVNQERHFFFAQPIESDDCTVFFSFSFKIDWYWINEKLTRLCKSNSFVHRTDRYVDCRSSTVGFALAAINWDGRPTSFLFISNIFWKTDHLFDVKLFGKCYNNGKWSLWHICHCH